MEDKSDYEISFIAEPGTLTLSPIIEMNESLIFNSSIVELDLSSRSIQDEQSKGSDSGSLQSCSESQRLPLNPPETPPQVVRDRLNGLQEQFEYLRHEHEELREFTQLERQVNHCNCVSKDEANSLKGELDSVNVKMQHLIQENVTVRNELMQKENEMADLSKKFATIQNSQKTLINSLPDIASKLKETLQSVPEEDVSEEGVEMLLVHVINNEELDMLSPEHLLTLILSALEDTQKLIENIINDRKTIKSKLEQLCLKNIESEEINKTLLQNNEQIKIDLNKSQIEINKLKEDLSIIHFQEQQLSNLLESGTVLDKQYSPGELLNANCLEPNQEEFSLILSELKIHFNNFEYHSFRSVINALKENEKLNSCINQILNPLNLTLLFETLNKLDIELQNYDDEYEVLKSKVNELSSKIEQFDKETEELRTEIKSMDTTKIDVFNRISTIEKLLDTSSNENVHLKESLISLEKENAKLECDIKKGTIDFIKFDNIQKETKVVLNQILDKYPSPLQGNIKFKEVLTSFLKNKSDFPVFNEFIDNSINDLLLNCFDKLDQTLSYYEKEKVSLEKRVEDIRVNIETLENENDMLKKSAREFEEKVELHQNDAAKQLKELLVVEVLNMEADVQEHELLDLTPKELFDKFMNSIMNLENEVSSNLQDEYDAMLSEKQNNLDRINDKMKTQEQWTKELENENNKMETEITTLSNNIKNASNEISILKTNISKLTSDNITLKEKLKNSNLLLVAEKETVDNLLNNLEEYKEENTNLRGKLSNTVLEQRKLCECMKTQVKSDSEVLNARENVNESDITQYPPFKTERILINSEVSCNKLSEMESTLDDLNKEKALLKEILTETDSNCSYDIFDKFIILKDIVQVVLNKILELEYLQANTRSELENTVETVSKDLSDLKLSLFELYKEFVPDDKTHSDFVDTAGDSVLSLKMELESVEQECLKITKFANKFQNVIHSGQSFIKSLKDQFLNIMNETNKKNVIIDNLKKVIEDEKQKVANSKYEIGVVTNKVNNLLLENTQLQHENKRLNLQLSDVKVIFSSEIFNVPGKMKSVKEQVEYLNEISKENINIKTSILVANETISFFSNQFCLMNSYIKKLEQRADLCLRKNKKLKQDLKLCDDFKSSIADANELIIFFSCQCNLMNLYINGLDDKINELQGQNKRSNYECSLLKEQLEDSNKQLDNANTIIKELLSVVPSKPTTPRGSLNVLREIITEHARLKESDLNFIKLQGELNVKSEEIKCLNKLNGNLKIELGKCEDHIRNLRSELRTTRSQYLKRVADGTMKSSHLTASEFAIQTDTLCCAQLQQDILKLKEVLNDRNNKVTNLERKLQNKRSPYRRTPSDSDTALIQAKERIKTLNLELMQLQNQNKELTELCKQKSQHPETKH